MQVDVYQTVGIHHHLIKTGTTVKGHLFADIPMKFKVIIDRIAEKFSIKIDVPKEVLLKYDSFEVKRRYY